MEHVSTLCAIGTVGIAATGFALGRNEASQPQPPPPAPKRRRSIFRNSYSSPLARVLDMSSSPADALPTRSSSNAHRPATSHVPPPKPVDDFSRSSPDTAHPVKDIPQEAPRTRPRRRTYVGPLPLSVMSGDDSTIEPLVASPTGRPSSSWLRRLSIISSSQNDSPLSGSRPDSPSLSGSTSPFFSSPFRMDQAPNKLVKRSSSQRVLANSHLQGTGSGSLAAPAPLLRRPATSHQRLANMRQQSSTDSRMQLEPPYSPLYPPKQTPSETFDSTNGTWRPYFRSEYPYSPEIRRRPSARHRDRSPRRLVPEPGVVPTLLLSSSITRDTPNHTYRHDQTRACINHDDTIPIDSATQPIPIGERSPQHPISVGEREIGTSPASWKSSAQGTLGRRRGFSFPKECSIEPDPLSDDLAAKLEGLGVNSMRLRKRRPVTDVDLFRRRSSSSPIEFTLNQLNPIVSENNSPKSRLRRRPQFSELRGEFPLGQIWCDLPLDPRSRSSSGEQSLNPSGNTFSSCSSRPKSQRLSAATSDPASTLVGSDNDTRIFSSGDEDETDFQSETAFDSLPTRVGVGNPPAHRGPPIETIFDKPSPSELACETVNVLENLTPNAVSNRLNALHDGDLNISDSPSLSADEPQILLLTQESIHRPDSLASSSTEISNDGPIEWNSLDDIEPMGDGDEQLPSYVGSSSSPSPLQGLIALRPRIDCSHSSITLDGTSGRETRVSLFDWSEQQRNDKDVRSSEFRPKTVHGKQVPDTRGGRTVTRRCGSAVHLRSQSVPIAREPSLSDNAHQFIPKFGTWGLGNKGVSEDWDGDFEFEDSDKQDESKGNDVQLNQLPSNPGMKVPKAIMERQASVHGQFGHVQELTLLVEELKRLHTRAGALNILDGQSNELWREAKGIINLATLEDDDEDEGNHSTQHQLPSTTFSIEDSDDDFFSNGITNDQSGRTNNDTRRSPLSKKINPNPSITPPPRPRTDSSLKAKFVLDTIHQKRSLQGTDNIASSTDPHQKLPFDTQSLRDLVIRAGVVTRSLKEVVRKAEGVCMGSETETNCRPQDPPFSQMFTRPQSDTESSRCLPGLARSKNTNGYRSIAAPSTTHNENDGCERMAMTVV
ncbi:hypothetical protein I7I53_06952 [Histoplasma capsulatum var. duboisii H88]|uniref:Uncharacterized protein n=2 Tax=Ajellomyces capsulatus (strain H88) TaxID=544711 RepID=A0A8A1LCU6_AJEC8|nr:hypothetical protein I7I53_06952 [Histoplasma capsulatum var. duboisii H88]